MTIKDVETLKSVLYLSSSGHNYIAGDPENYFFKDPIQNLDFVKKFVCDVDRTEQLLKCIESASNDKCLPRRVTLFYVLAFALTQTDSKESKIRRLIASRILIICKTYEELFKFISIFSKLNSDISKNTITTAVGHVINKFLNNKTFLEYTHEVGKRKGHHGWKYKDLIKLSHFKGSSKEKEFITSYVLFGLEKLKDQETAKMKLIYEILEKFERLKKTEDEKEASTLVTELHADFSQVNPKFVKSKKVWSSIIPELPVEEVLKLLPKLNKYGLLNPNSEVHAAVIKAVTTEDKVRQSNLNPLEVFIHMKNFEKGGKPLHPKLEQYLISKSESSSDVKEKIEKMEKFRSEPKCSIITSALEKCMSYSHNPKSRRDTGKRILMALDVTASSESEPVCFKNKNITCLEAQLALANYYSQVEKNITVTIYQNSDIEEFKLDKSVPFAHNLQKLKDKKSDYMLLPSVFDWAIERKQQVDLFICFVQNASTLNAGSKEVKTADYCQSVKSGLRKYKKLMIQSSTRLVLICLGEHNVAGFEDLHELTICGFCPEILNVINAYTRCSYLSFSTALYG